MRRLATRVVVILSAAALVGLLALDIAFLFWGQRRFAVEARLELRAALLEVALDPGLATDPMQVIARCAEQHHVVITLVDDHGTPLATGPVPLPDLTTGAANGASSAFDHQIEPLAIGAWRFAIASRARAETLAAVFATQRWALIVLAIAGLLIVGLGTILSLRAILWPLRHMTDLVRRQELAGLGDLSQSGGSDDLVRLGHAIITMNQTIREDRERIAAQVRELTDKNSELATAQHQLVRAERLAVVGQLAAGLAHEVGNPLAILSGYVDMLKSETLETADRQSALTRMGRELDRIHTTMRNLLDFSRAPAMPESRNSDLRAVIADVCALVAPQLKGIELDAPAPAAALMVPVGNDATTQLVLNLVLNAIDAVGRQGRIALAIEQTQDGIALHVDDSGPGVPADLRTRIFEPFFTTKPVGKGTGLGLAVCERIVATAGGDIRVSTSTLGGARFSVTFPA